MSGVSNSLLCQNKDDIQIKKSHKLSRKKRRRLMKRKLKKNKLKNKPKSLLSTVEKLQSSQLQTNPSKFNNMGSNSFWEKHRADILTWQYKHEIAYWKSKAEALNYENNVLHSVIENMCKSRTPHVSNIKQHSYQETCSDESVSGNEGIDGENDSDDSDESDIHFNDDVLAFLQKSAEHRLDREKKRQAEEDHTEIENDVNIPRQVIDNKRNEEINLLYGASSKNIDGIETMVQLNFDRFMDMNKPIMWPNIPLKLN